MKPAQKVSRAALDLIERFEGYRRSAAQLEDGRWTIGYGHTRSARAGLEVSEADAEALLLYDLIEVAKAINEWVFTPLTQNQFDALAAFAFNVGLDQFRRSSVLRRLNEGQLLQAACAMELWRRADFEGETILIDALVRRRAAEKALFLTPAGGFMPAPTAVLRPKLDSEIASAVPAQKPVEVTTPLYGDRAVAERIGPLEDYRPLPAMEAQEAPTASQAAADAVTARLQSLLSEDEPAAAPSEPAPAEQAQPAFEPQAAAQPAESEFTLTSPPYEAEAPYEPQEAPRSVAEDAGPQLFASQPMAFDEFESQPVIHHEFDVNTELDETPLEPVRGLNPVAMLAGLAILGLIVFAAGIFWGFQANHAGGIFSPRALVGWALGFTGIGCVATAVYFLLERLGGREEQ
jgi:lysozyme